MVRERSGHDSSFPCSSCRLPAEISTGPSRERSRSLGTQIACHKERGHVAPPAAISLVSASALAYEVLLTRLFSIVQWHHFAYMAISIALLGYGASGSFLALFQDRLRPRFNAVFTLMAALFGVSAVGGFALAKRLPFNALAVIWEPRQLLYLVAYYLLFATPFFCAATCVGLAFAAFPNHIARVYRYDMVGAGLGALGVIAVLFWLFPTQALRVVGGLGLLAAALASRQEVGARRWWRTAAYLIGAALVYVAVPTSWTALRFSEYKELAQALLIPGTEVVREESSPLGLLKVIRSPLIPLRHAPGLSLSNSIELPPQLGVLTDGGSLSPITAFDGGLEPLGYIDYTSAALPYHLLGRPDALIIGAGGGADVLLALYHRAARIDAVELNPQLVRLVGDIFADFAGHLYDRPEVRVRLSDERSFDVAYCPGMRREEANRYNILEQPYFFDGSTALLGSDHASFLRRYKFDVSPTTDDRPYFFDFFKW